MQQDIVEIDENTFDLNCYTMSKEDLDVKMIIGLDIMKDCELKITPEKTSLKRQNAEIDLPRNRNQSIDETSIIEIQKYKFYVILFVFRNNIHITVCFICIIIIYKLSHNFEQNRNSSSEVVQGRITLNAIHLFM